MSARARSAWPPFDRTEARILELALGDDRHVAERWGQLQPLDLDALRRGSLCVLPLVHERLTENGVEHPLVARLAGISRKIWYRHQLHLERLPSVTTALRQAGVRPILYDAAARAALYFRGPGVRSVPWLECLVAPSEAPAARAALLAAGWRAAGEPAAVGAKERFSDGVCGVVLQVGAPRQLVEEHVRAEVWDTFLADARRHDLGGVDVTTLAPADELLLVCGFDATHGNPSGLQWIIDAYAIVGSKAPIDFAELEARSRHLGLLLPVRAALGRLDELSETVHLAEVVAVLGRQPIRRRDRIAHRLLTTAGGPLRGLPRKLGEHLHATRSQPFWRVAGGVPGHLLTWRRERARRARP